MVTPSDNPNRFDSIAGTWSEGVLFITWMHETKTGECKIEWDLGSGTRTREFKDYDSAQKYYTMLLKSVS